MARQTTLLNFFNDITPRKAHEKSTSNDKKFKTPSKVVEKKEEFPICDVVWAKLEGYPWWPSLICQHPKTKSHIKGDNIHVQFFDNPPTRAWISKKCIEKYSSDSDKRNPKYCNNSELKNLKRACKEADAASALHIDDRKSLLFDFNSVTEEQKKSEESSPVNNKENQSHGEDDEDEGFSAKKPRLSKVFVFDSDDSDDEYKPDEHEDEHEDSCDDELSGNDSILSESVEEEEEPEETPPKGIKRKRNQSLTSSRKKTCQASTSKTDNYYRDISAKAKLSLFKNTPGSATKTPEVKQDDWPHLKLDFLQPDKIMDAEKRRPNHPDYDKKTLYVPEEFKTKCTPGVRQWWELKAKHFDCILFFKVGKFYELYHMDAVIGVNELSLTFMKGEFAHSGFPEISYGRFSTILVQKGYKVARVEQTETPEMMLERCKNQIKTTKFDKVVRREICQVTTKGTQIFSFIDGEAKESETNYLLALAEKNDNLNRITYGVCFIDTSIGTFHLGQFQDDKFLSRLRTLLSHNPPAQILYEKYQISSKTMHLLRSSFNSVLQEPLAAETEFWSAAKTLTFLAENHFSGIDVNGKKWPEAIQKFINPADSLGLSASNEGELAVKAFGACIWYLKECFLDQQLLAMKKFEIYRPVDSSCKSLGDSENIELGRYMVLDGLALSNLEVLLNSNGEKTGTLLQRLDHCCTFSGKRLIRQWLCNPLCNISGIVSRQEAIAELLEKAHVVQEVRNVLKKVPDVERLLGKIHTQGNAIRSKTHPDSRAILFEDKIYSKRKIQDFLSALVGFEKIQNAIEILQKDSTWNSKLLQQCIMFAPEGKFKDLTEHLMFFKNAFDHDLAKREGCIIPQSSGVDVEYDAVIDELKSIEKELNAYLRSQCQYFGTTVKYFGSDKNRYQLEVPESQAKKADSKYEFTSCRKGFKRFVTAETKEFLRRQKQAEETKSNILKDLCRRVFAQFSDKYEDWMAAIQCSSLLDVLMSLVEYCRSENGETCFPEFTKPCFGEKPFVDISNGRHPCLLLDNGFIPNDIRMGVDSTSNLVLLTGPNMGGKSTLMRQLGLIVVMAQVGLKVPAETCKLTPVDRIFTRIGAKDDILAGESTFYTELSEASLILNSASQYSLVLMDELGRGTSTYDGTAIAHSVVRELSQRGSRTLFSTHYHILVDDFKTSDFVSLGHMACMVETDEEDPSEETVTFLYKFVNGACPKSYGFNAAKLAGVPLQIIKSAREKTAALEKESEKRKIFKKICSVEKFENLEQLLKSIQLVN